jgi:hypothetical protein
VVVGSSGLPELRSWDTIIEILHLSRSGRPNASRCLWQRLPESFQKAMMKFVLVIAEAPQDVRTCPTVRMRSRYGEFELSSSLLLDLKEVIPTVI